MGFATDMHHKPCWTKATCGMCVFHFLYKVGCRYLFLNGGITQHIYIIYIYMYWYIYIITPFQFPIYFRRPSQGSHISPFTTSWGSPSSSREKHIKPSEFASVVSKSWGMPNGLKMNPPFRMAFRGKLLVSRSVHFPKAPLVLWSLGGIFQMWFTES